MAFLTRTEVKDHLVIEHDDDDTMIDTLIGVAESIVENYTNRVLTAAVQTDYLDGFPVNYIQLQKAPFSSLTSITYVDVNGATQTWTASPEPWVIDTDNGLTRIHRAYGQTFPDARYQKKSVTITYRAGYEVASPEASTVPGPLKQAGLLLIGSMYDQRENHVTGVQQYDIPVSAQWLMAPYKVYKP